MANEYIPQDLANQVAALIAAGIKKGSKQGFESADFVSELNKQIAEYNDNDKARVFNERVRALAAKTGLNAREAELEVLAQQAAEQAVLNGLGNEYIADMAKLVAIRREQLAVEIEQEEQQKKAAEIAEKIKKYDHERHEILEKIKVQQELMKDIFTDQRIAQAVLMTQVIRGAHSVAHAFQHIREEGFTMTQALAKTGKAATIAFNPFNPVNMKEALGAMKGLTEQLGSTEEVTKELIKDSAMLAKTFGISAEQAGKLTAQMMQLPGATAETANSTLEFAGALAKAAHVAPGEVMKEIANNSEAFATYAKDGGKNVATAAVAAKKLGMEFSSLVKMSEGLLDFESSINKQMEASVLLGREINLDKARELSLNGDLVGATQEVLKNVGGEAEFNKMNVMQRKALADSLGVSVTDLGKMVQNQDKLTNLTEEQKMALADGSLTMDEVLASTGGYASKMKEAGITTAAALGSFKGIKESVNSARESLGGLIEGFKGGTGILGKFKGAVKGGLSGPDIETKAISDKLSGATREKGEGSKGFLKGLGDGLASIGKQFVDVVKGAAALGIAGVALGGGFALAMMMVKDVDPIQMIAFAGSLTMLGLTMALLGNIGANVILGAVAMGILALSLIPAAFAFSLLEGVDTDKIIAFSIALPLLGLAAAGLGLLSPAIAFGAIALTTLGAGMIAVAGGLMILQAAGGIQVFESLTAVASNAAGLGGVAMALMGIGAGLSTMAVAGIAAMPVIASLVTLAAVAPALVGLGAAVGGLLGGGEGEGSLKAVEEKLDTLIGVIQKGGVVNMDGQKVGEVVALALNTTGG